MTEANFIIYRVVGGGDFQSARAKLGIHRFIGNNGNFSVDSRDGEKNSSS